MVSIAFILDKKEKAICNISQEKKVTLNIYLILRILLPTNQLHNKLILVETVYVFYPFLQEAKALYCLLLHEYQ